MTIPRFEHVFRSLLMSTVRGVQDKHSLLGNHFENASPA